MVIFWQIHHLSGGVNNFFVFSKYETLWLIWKKEERAAVTARVWNVPLCYKQKEMSTEERLFFIYNNK